MDKPNFRGPCTFKFIEHIICYEINGGAFMPLIYLSGFLAFLKTAIFVFLVTYQIIAYFQNPYQQKKKMNIWKSI